MTAEPSDPVPLDLGAVVDPQVLAVGRVPARSRVLLLGPEREPLAAALRAMDCAVVLCGADPEEIRMGLAGQRFDVIVVTEPLADLADPVGVLTAAASVLDERGWAVVDTARAPVDADTTAGSAVGDVAAAPALVDVADGPVGSDIVEQAGWAPVRTGIPATAARARLLVVAPRPGRAHERPPVLPAAVAQELLAEARARIAVLEAEVARPGRTVPPDLLDRLEAIRRASQRRRADLYQVVEAIRAGTDAVLTRSRKGDGHGA